MCGHHIIILNYPLIHIDMGIQRKQMKNGI